MKTNLRSCIVVVDVEILGMTGNVVGSRFSEAIFVSAWSLRLELDPDLSDVFGCTLFSIENVDLYSSHKLIKWVQTWEGPVFHCVLIMPRQPSSL